MIPECAQTVLKERLLCIPVLMKEHIVGCGHMIAVYELNSEPDGGLCENLCLSLQNPVRGFFEVRARLDITTLVAPPCLRAKSRVSRAMGVNRKVLRVDVSTFRGAR